MIISGGKTIPNHKNAEHVISDNNNFYIADYVTVTRSGGYMDITTNANTTGAGFAVSTSSIVSGAYNNAIGAAWDLSAGDCILEKITKKNSSYYLWYRGSDSEPYRLLTQLV